ncbi:hypothetical protein Tco_0651658 [Tanacetum coccineum]|uniref:Uncharacterized protein n=1 Tax=Tanacetum coccineum TaxID=301880 RepID=A0ABQ4WVE0_9ASTR
MNAMNTTVNKKINDDGSTGTIHLEQNFGASLAHTTQKDLNVGIPSLEITIRKQNVDSAKDDMVDILTPNVDVESLGAKGKESGFMEGDLVDRESGSDVEEDNSETSSFMASKSSKGTSSSKSGGRTIRKSLYERWKYDYEDNSYDNDEERKWKIN